MDDDDLRAIFRYLRTLPPVDGGPDPTLENAVVVGGDQYQPRAQLPEGDTRTYETVRHVRSARPRGRGAARVGAAGACRRCESAPPAPTPAPAMEGEAIVFGWVVPEQDNFVMADAWLDVRQLHIEARYNYEALHSGSSFVGANASVGDKLAIAATGMLGAVFGDTDGIVPGFRITRDVVEAGPVDRRRDRHRPVERRQQLLLQLVRARLLALELAARRPRRPADARAAHGAGFRSWAVRRRVVGQADRDRLRARRPMDDADLGVRPGRPL